MDQEIWMYNIGLFIAFNLLNKQIVLFLFNLRLPWRDDDLPTYCLTLTIHVVGVSIYCAAAYSQVGIIVGFYFYAKCFVEDIRYQFKTRENSSNELEVKKCFIDIVELHLVIVG